MGMYGKVSGCGARQRGRVPRRVKREQRRGVGRRRARQLAARRVRGPHRADNVPLEGTVEQLRLLAVAAAARRARNSENAGL